MDLSIDNLYDGIGFRSVKYVLFKSVHAGRHQKGALIYTYLAFTV